MNMTVIENGKRRRLMNIAIAQQWIPGLWCQATGTKVEIKGERLSPEWSYRELLLLLIMVMWYDDDDDGCWWWCHSFKRRFSRRWTEHWASTTTVRVTNQHYSSTHRLPCTLIVHVIGAWLLYIASCYTHLVSLSLLLLTHVNIGTINIGTFVSLVSLAIKFIRSSHLKFFWVVAQVDLSCVYFTHVVSKLLCSLPNSWRTPCGNDHWTAYTKETLPRWHPG